MPGEFTDDHFSVLKKWGGHKYEEKNQEMQLARSVLAEAYQLTYEWAQALAKQLSSSAMVKVRRSPTNQAGNFSEYTWAKIYPDEKSPQMLAYTVGIDSDGFTVKIDTVGLGSSSPIRIGYERLRGDYDNSSIVAKLSASEGSKLSLDDLVLFSVHAIEKFKPSYQDICNELQLGKISAEQELLKHFQQHNDFKRLVNEWSQEVRAVFIRFAREVHEAGLDWWFTQTTNSQLVFGRKEISKRGKPLGALFLQSGGSIRVHWNSVGSFPKKNWTEIRSELVGEFESMTSGLAEWPYYMSVDMRDGFWPDDYAGGEMEADARNNEMETSPSKNLILYGPPGTGKTYHTINEALQILDLELLESQPDRPALKEAFDELIAAGQIVFATFHQSFSYEDFVEGLRAKTSKNGQIEYSVESGVFKALCEQAARGIPAAEDPFDAALAALQEKLEQAEGRLELQTSKGNPFGVSYEGGSTFLVYPASNPDLKNGYTGSMDQVRKLYQTGDKSGIYNSSYVVGMLNFLMQHCGLPAYKPAPTKDRKRFVLIIDEINRGNISRIFGELITLIEPSKRAGAAEALSVTLPYSKDLFSVPDNVYIIGTMNTADRSLAGLDIALRRRFTFKEMPPKPELLDGLIIEGTQIDIGRMLRVMNQRIAVLLDRDHCLGHAYFMPLLESPTLETLAEIFRQNIIPLLQEYFFEDWERIGWVLNDHANEEQKQSDCCFIVKDQSLETKTLFGSAADKLGNSREVWKLNAGAFGLAGSYEGIGQAEPDANK